MKRREFLLSTAAAAAAAPVKAPFRVLYSNDTTNVMVVSPSHAKGAPFSPELIEAAVDEAQGADVHLLQPGLCWIPWWKSAQYPATEHYKWFHDNTGLQPDSFGKYMVAGGDMVKVFVDRCRKRGITPFVSFRLNDAHHLENAGANTGRAVNVSRFYTEHPEFRIGTNLEKADQAVQNWAIPEVRAHKFGFIKELCEGYDIDGFELDFLRFWTLFRQTDTTSQQRARIMTQFVVDVRQLLDRTSRGGRRRWLSARIPCRTVGFDKLGIDLSAFCEAGLDIVNVSSSYFTRQRTDLATIRKMAPRAAIYLEMTHSVFNGPNRARYDNFQFLRTTEQQFYTTANLAYQQGADGLSLFNFVYYREHGGPGRGPFNEPPFHVLKHLGDRHYVARQPQWYVLAKTTQPPLPDEPMPRVVKTGQPQTFRLELAPTGSDREGLLRLRTLEESDRKWKVQCNGGELTRNALVARPLPHPYDANLEIGGAFACFRLPRRLVRKGPNDVTVEVADGQPVTVDYIDLVLP